MALVMGVFPTLFLKPMEASVDALVQRVQAQRQTLRGIENVEHWSERDRTASNAPNAD